MREKQVQKNSYMHPVVVCTAQEKWSKRNINVASKWTNGFYISSKLCSEVLADNYKQFMDVIILRLFFVYGKKQKLIC